jgi:hypothetical protein
MSAQKIQTLSTKKDPAEAVLPRLFYPAIQKRHSRFLSGCASFGSAHSFISAWFLFRKAISFP